ncbi:MAG: sugar phosphate isomerase/epimerase family protein [Pleomorphochaeta sp.]
MIGFRAHDFGKFDDFDCLINEIKKFNTPTCIQFALSKVLNNYNSYSNLPNEVAKEFSTKLLENNISIAIIGCYINPIHPNIEIRKKQWDDFEKALVKAKYLNCPYVATETGITNLNDEYDIETFSQKNLTIFYNFLDKMLPIAQKNNSIITIEPVADKHTICSIERTTNMLNKFKCENLKIIYDSVNLMSKQAIKEIDGSVKKVPTYEAQKKFHDYFLNVLYKDIVALHIKDFKIDNHGNKIGDLPIGSGVMNYKALFDSLNNHQIKAPKLLEMVDLNTLNQTIKTLKTLDIND